jgi:hypothetical protein
MKVSKRVLKRLIRESIDKQTKNLTKKAGADTPPEIAADFGGGNQGEIVADDFSEKSFKDTVATTRRSFLKMMTGIGASLGIGGGAMLSKDKPIALTDDELFEQAGFKLDDAYLHGYEGESVAKAGQKYHRHDELMSGVKIEINVSWEDDYSVPGDRVYGVEFRLIYNEDDNLFSEFDIAFQEAPLGDARDTLEYIAGEGLQFMQSEYMEALEKKFENARLGIKNANEIYNNARRFDDPNNMDVTDVPYYKLNDLPVPEYAGIYEFWQSFTQKFGTPVKTLCSASTYGSGISGKELVDLVSASMIVTKSSGTDRKTSGLSSHSPAPGIMTAIEGTFNGKSVVYFKDSHVGNLWIAFME